MKPHTPGSLSFRARFRIIRARPRTLVRSLRLYHDRALRADDERLLADPGEARRGAVAGRAVEDESRERDGEALEGAVLGRGRAVDRVGHDDEAVDGMVALDDARVADEFLGPRTARRRPRDAVDELVVGDPVEAGRLGAVTLGLPLDEFVPDDRLDPVEVRLDPDLRAPRARAFRDRTDRTVAPFFELVRGDGRGRLDSGSQTIHSLRDPLSTGKHPSGNATRESIRRRRG